MGRNNADHYAQVEIGALIASPDGHGLHCALWYVALRLLKTTSRYA